MIIRSASATHSSLNEACRDNMAECKSRWGFCVRAVGTGAPQVPRRSSPDLSVIEKRSRSRSEACSIKMTYSRFGFEYRGSIWWIVFTNSFPLWLIENWLTHIHEKFNLNVCTEMYFENNLYFNYFQRN